MTRLLALALVVAVAGCSMALDSPRPGAPELRCTTSSTVPVVDLVLATTLIGTGVALGFHGDECRDCRYLAGLAVVLGVVYLLDAPAAQAKVTACRREHARRTEELEAQRDDADRAARIEASPFFCTIAEADPDVSVCGGSRSACEEHQQQLLATGVMVSPCAPRDTASCFDARTTAGAASRLCFATAAACQTQRGLKAARADYAEVGDCGWR